MNDTLHLKDKSCSLTQESAPESNNGLDCPPEENVDTGIRKRAEQIYNAYSSKVYGYISSHVSNRQDVDDIHSMVFERILRALAKGPHSEVVNPDGWVYSITRNAVIDFYRRRAAGWEQVELSEELGAVLPSDENIEEDYLKKEQLDILTEGLKSLTEEERRMIILYYYHNHTRQEIAEIMGITYGKVRVLNRRALSKLQAFFPEISLEGI